MAAQQRPYHLVYAPIIVGNGIGRHHETSRRDAGAPGNRSHFVWALTEPRLPNMLLFLCCTANWFPPLKGIRGD